MLFGATLVMPKSPVASAIEEEKREVRVRSEKNGVAEDKPSRGRGD